jgi:hypothetical protein
MKDKLLLSWGVYIHVDSSEGRGSVPLSKFNIQPMDTLGNASQLLYCIFDRDNLLYIRILFSSPRL